MKHHIWIILFVIISFSVSSVRADFVIGTGTQLDCKESVLRTALATGGLISFNCGPSPHTILISDTLFIDTDTIIDGDGLITLDGIGSTQIFSNNGHELQLRNLTIRNARGSRGGALHTENGTVLIENVSFNVNRAVARSGNALLDGYGAAIFSSGGVLEISNSRFIGNRADNWGGAIFVSGGEFNIENSRFILNVAGEGGGAISNGIHDASLVASTGVITDSMFSFNMAGDNLLDQGKGGAIYSKEGFVFIIESYFGANIANWGGAIFADEYTDPISAVVISGSEFNANLNNALYSYQSFRADATEFTNNRSNGVGGAIFVSANVGQVSDSTFTSNRAGNSGGAIYNQARDFTLRNSTLLSNIAASGGALYNSSLLREGTHRLIQNSTFSANEARRGAAIYDATLLDLIAAHSGLYATNIEYSTFAYNRVRESGGSVIYGANDAVQIRASILTYSDGANCNIDFSPLYRVIEYPSASCGGDIVADPLLAPLADNGGLTMTYALQAGSPAIDAVTGSPLTTGSGSPEDPIVCGVDVDQRYFVRPFNATGSSNALCDIGAYEYLASGTMSFALVQATPEPTLVPVPTLIPVIVNCRSFRATSPLDGLPNGVATFYWDAAPGASNYVVNVINEVGQQVASFSVDAPTTTLTGDVSYNTIGSGTNFTWVVQALYNGRVYCTSQTTIPRESPNIPPPPAQNTPVPQCGNGIREQGETPNSCPNGY